MIACKTHDAFYLCRTCGSVAYTSHVVDDRQRNVTRQLSCCETCLFVIIEVRLFSLAPMFITPSASITSSPSTQREDVTALPPSDVSLALSWYWVLTVVVLCLVVALVTAYVVYLHFRKKNRRKADDEARRWREDIATSGQDDGSRVNTPTTAAEPWNGPPSQASMREKRDPFQNIGRRKGAEVEVDSSRLPSVESVGKRKSPRAEPTLASLPDTPEPRYQQLPTKLSSLSKEKMVCINRHMYLIHRCNA